MPTERCNCEIPLSSSPAACDAVVCGADADLECDEGPRCQSCFETYGGTPVQPQTPAPAVRLDFGLTMCAVLDSLFADPDAEQARRMAVHQRLSQSDPCWPWTDVEQGGAA